MGGTAGLSRRVFRQAQPTELMMDRLEHFTVERSLSHGTDCLQFVFGSQCLGTPERELLSRVRNSNPRPRDNDDNEHCAAE